MSNIGVTIRNYRESKNITIEELALKIRIGTNTLKRYEDGDSIPTLQTILKISTALDIPASDLLDK